MRIKLLGKLVYILTTYTFSFTLSFVHVYEENYTRALLKSSHLLQNEGHVLTDTVQLWNIADRFFFCIRNMNILLGDNLFIFILYSVFFFQII